MLATAVVSPGAIGQAPPASKGTPAQIPLNGDFEETAHILGLDSQLHKLLVLQSQRPTGAPATLEELAVRQELLESVEATAMDVDSVIAEISSEQSEIGSIRTELQAHRDRTVSRFTTAALLTGSGLGTAVSATQFTTLSSKTQNVGDAIGIGSGAASTILSILAARAQKGPRGIVEETPNMLAPLLGGTPALNTYYAPAVLRYLHSVPAGEDPSEGTRLGQLMAQWDRTGRLSETNPPERSQEIAALTSSGDPKVKVSIDDLTNRVAMLGDVRARVSLMKRDLATLIHNCLANQ